MESDRPSRRAKRMAMPAQVRPTAVHGKDVLGEGWFPHRSSAHFVGYVEDEESVEMIMKKFEALEQFQKELGQTTTDSGAINDEHNATPGTLLDKPNYHVPKTSAPTNATAPTAASAPKAAPQQTAAQVALSDAQLEELFKRTSNFTVRSAMMPTANLYDDEDDFVDALLKADEGDEDFAEEMEIEGAVAKLKQCTPTSFAAYVDNDFWDDLEEEDRPRKRGRLPSSTGPVQRRARESREDVVNRYRIMQFQLQDRQGNTFTVKRKVQQVDPTVPTYVRVPPDPIPRAWAHEIVPLSRQPASQASVPGSRLFSANCADLDDELVKQLGNRFQAIYMDPPLQTPSGTARPGTITMAQFAALPVPKLIQRGLLFIWVDKENIYDVLQVAEQWRFKCVENICWIRMQRNHRIVDESSSLINKTKLTLLVLRKDGELELRHQRNPDCVFDFVKPSVPGELTCEKPSFVYEIIETLLPQAVYSKENNRGFGLLEL